MTSTTDYRTPVIIDEPYSGSPWTCARRETTGVISEGMCTLIDEKYGSSQQEYGIADMTGVIPPKAYTSVQ